MFITKTHYKILSALLERTKVDRKESLNSDRTNQNEFLIVERFTTKLYAVRFRRSCPSKPNRHTKLKTLASIIMVWKSAEN